jgi:DNA-directed RNA polymerase subunit RPC12/RpoP
VISEQDIARIQDQLGKLALDVVRIDVDGFIEASDLIGSPQALTAGVNPKAVASAGEWAEMARLVKPFRDHAVERINTIREELAENDDDLLTREAACPGCGERRVDELSINEDDSVVCATCGRRYQVPASGAGEE